MLWPETRLGAVRAGIAIYGLVAARPRTAGVMRERGGFTLEPALSWTTQLVAVHEVPAHTPVGYGCAYHTKRPSRIGVLPIGYAEDLPRALIGDRAFVLVAGRRVRIVGRVCMDMAFVDVTEIADAAPETPVTLIGRDGDATLTADDLAAACGTINYEIVARLPAHVPRSACSLCFDERSTLPAGSVTYASRRSAARCFSSAPRSPKANPKRRRRSRRPAGRWHANARCGPATSPP